MIETAVALLFAHVLADFVLQTDAMVRHKRRPLVLLGHVAIVTERLVEQHAAVGTRQRQIAKILKIANLTLTASCRHL